jgi:hypothetical protein
VECSWVDLGLWLASQISSQAPLTAAAIRGAQYSCTQIRLN